MDIKPSQHVCVCAYACTCAFVREHLACVLVLSSLLLLLPLCALLARACACLRVLARADVAVGHGPGCETSLHELPHLGICQLLSCLVPVCATAAACSSSTCPPATQTSIFNGSVGIRCWFGAACFPLVHPLGRKRFY